MDILDRIKGAERHLKDHPSVQLASQLEEAKQRYLGVCAGTENMHGALAQVHEAIEAVSMVSLGSSET